MERLGEGAFLGCKQLEHVELPRSLKEIGKSVFGYCEGLIAIKIPEGVERLGEGAFELCEQLEHVELPRSLKEIGRSAFRLCEGLIAIKIPEGVERLGERVFECCKQLEHVDLPSILREIGMWAFGYCSSLKAIKIPERVEKMEEYTFSGCKQLIVAYVPQNVQLDDNVFQGVSAGFVRYSDIVEYNALPVVADVSRRGIELNARPIVCVTKQPYFRFINREIGLDLFPSARKILLTLLLVQNQKQTESPGSFPPEILAIILGFLKWSELSYPLSIDS